MSTPTILTLVFSGMLLMIFGAVLGLNVGIARASMDGPRAACESLRIQLIVCEKLP